MAENPASQVLKADVTQSEKQQLVAGVFASRVVADAALEKIEGLHLQFQAMNTSNILGFLPRTIRAKLISTALISVRLLA